MLHPQLNDGTLTCLVASMGMHTSQLVVLVLKEDGQGAQADATNGVLMVASESRSFSVREILDAVLNTWSVSKTAKALHSGMHPDDQQIILEWMLDHPDVTITRFAQVSAQSRCHACDWATLSTCYGA